MKTKQEAWTDWNGTHITMSNEYDAFGAGFNSRQGEIDDHERKWKESQDWHLKKNIQIESLKQQLKDQEESHISSIKEIGRNLSAANQANVKYMKDLREAVGIIQEFTYQGFDFDIDTAKQFLEKINTNE